MGGYIVYANYTHDTPSNNCKSTGNTGLTCKMDVNTFLLGKYMAAAAITTAKPVASSETYVDISAAGAGGGNWQFKAVSAGAAGVALADLDAKWYFPKYVKPAKVDAEDAATGDRLNKGDKLSVFVGGQKVSSASNAAAGVAGDACGTGIAVDKGAATLAAGSLALAAALAM